MSSLPPQGPRGRGDRTREPWGARFPSQGRMRDSQGGSRVPGSYMQPPRPPLQYEEYPPYNSERPRHQDHRISSESREPYSWPSHYGVSQYHERSSWDAPRDSHRERQHSRTPPPMSSRDAERYWQSRRPEMWDQSGSFRDDETPSRVHHREESMRDREVYQPRTRSLSPMLQDEDRPRPRPRTPPHQSLSQPLIASAPDSRTSVPAAGPAPTTVAQVFAPVPVVSWPSLDVSPVANDEDAKSLLDSLRAYGALAVRKLRPNRKKGAPYHVYVLFKDLQSREGCQEILKKFDDELAIVAFNYHQTLRNFVAYIDVPYIAQVYARARSVDEQRDLLSIGPSPLDSKGDIELEILDYKRFPPLPNTHPKPAKLMRMMQVVEFDTEWLSAKLARPELPLSSGARLWLHRLELMMHAHVDDVHGLKSYFFTEIWPTTGLMCRCIRTIARWAGDEFGAARTSSTVETFGRTKARSAWRIVLELDLEDPRYLKWCD
jgi:hypothetical protein